MSEQPNIQAQINALLRELEKDMRQSVLIELALQIRATANHTQLKGNQ